MLFTTEVKVLEVTVPPLGPVWEVLSTLPPIQLHIQPWPPQPSKGLPSIVKPQNIRQRHMANLNSGYPHGAKCLHLLQPLYDLKVTWLMNGGPVASHSYIPPSRKSLTSSSVSSACICHPVLDTEHVLFGQERLASLKLICSFWTVMSFKIWVA